MSAGGAAPHQISCFVQRFIRTSGGAAAYRDTSVMSTSNRAVGWTSIAVGIAVGLVMGLWSFDGPMTAPHWIGGYADTSRRLIRLGHIAFIGLGLLDILLDDELRRSSLDSAGRSLASRLMILGNVFLPIGLLVAGAWAPAKYVLPLPASCVFAAMLLAAWGARRPAAR
jgi:hypothetical protein